MKLLHSVCAKLIYAKFCLTECAISNVVDYKFLKHYKGNEIKIVNPIDFVQIMEEEELI